MPRTICFQVIWKRRTEATEARTSFCRCSRRLRRQRWAAKQPSDPPNHHCPQACLNTLWINTKPRGRRLVGDSVRPVAEELTEKRIAASRLPRPMYAPVTAFPVPHATPRHCQTAVDSPTAYRAIATIEPYPRHPRIAARCGLRGRA